MSEVDILKNVLAIGAEAKRDPNPKAAQFLLSHLPLCLSWLYGQLLLNRLP